MAADPKIFFGIVLEVDNTEIALEPKNAVSDIKKKGVDVGLPPDKRVALGPLGKSLRGILEAVEVDSTEIDGFLTEEGLVKADALPDIDVLQNAVNLLLQANLAVEQFHVKLPPTERADGTPIPKEQREDTAYTLGLSATWVADAGTLVGSLKLRGMYFKVSNEEG